MAFVRCWAEGLDLGTAWRRYRPDAAAGAANPSTAAVQAIGADARRARSLLRQLLDALRALARAHGRPDLAVLLRRDPEAMADAPAGPPDLDSFRADQPADFYSEAELLALYRAQHGGAPSAGAARRRQRLRERLVAAVQWLGERASPAPLPTDPLAQWLDERVCARLAAAGLNRFAELGARMQRQGRGWHRGVPWFGVASARRLEAWWQGQAASLGPLPFDATGGGSPGQGASPSGAGALEPMALAFGMVPLERFAPPPGLDGRAGANRPARDQALGAAHPPSAPDDDRSALLQWLQAQPGSAHTRRSYRQQVERLWLWCALVRHKPLSSLVASDVPAYLAFLVRPDPGWCGPRHARRGSRLWRPLEGPLSAGSVATAVAVLRSLFAALVRAGYLARNPWIDGLRAAGWSPAHGLAGPAAPAQGLQPDPHPHLGQVPGAATVHATTASPSPGSARHLQAMVDAAAPPEAQPSGHGSGGAAEAACAPAHPHAPAGLPTGRQAPGAGRSSASQPALAAPALAAPPAPPAPPTTPTTPTTPSAAIARRRAAVLQLVLGAGLRLAELSAARRSWLRPLVAADVGAARGAPPGDGGGRGGRPARGAERETERPVAARWVLVVPDRPSPGQAVAARPGAGPEASFDARSEARGHRWAPHRSPRRIPLPPAVVAALLAHWADLDALWGKPAVAADHPIIGRLAHRRANPTANPHPGGVGEGSPPAASPIRAAAAQPLSAARIAAMVHQAGRERAAAGRPERPADPARAGQPPQRWSVRQLRRAHVEIALADGMPRPVLRHRLGWRSRSALGRYAAAAALPDGAELA